MLARNERTLSFHLSSTYDLHIKAENERFTAARAARLFFSRSTNHIIDVTLLLLPFLKLPNVATIETYLG